MIMSQETCLFCMHQGTYEDRGCGRLDEFTSVIKSNHADIPFYVWGCFLLFKLGASPIFCYSIT